MAKHARWYFNVSNWRPSREDWLKLTSSIELDEVDRINKFQFQEDSKSSLIGCALIKNFVSVATGTNSKNIVITRTEHGRPTIAEQHKNSNWPKLIDFNVSHSGDYCVLAGVWSDNMNTGLKVGVDVTRIIQKRTKEELHRFLSLMSRREFTKGEWSTVELANSDRRKCINFTRLWCLKESFIKAIGLGLKFKLHRIDFRFNDPSEIEFSPESLKNRMLDSTTVFLDEAKADDWMFLETALDDNHLTAIGYKMDQCSTRADIPRDTFQEITIDCLLNSLTLMREPREQDWLHFTTRGSKPMIN